MKKLIEKIKKNVLIKRTSTVLFMLSLIVIFIGLTLWINSLELNPIDMTKEKLYTLTQTSKDKIKDINQQVNIYFVGYSDNNEALDLAKQYHNANENIKVETADASERPDLVQKYGIEENSTGIIVECGQKTKVLSVDDLTTYDMETYEQIDISEEKITNAIIYVTAEKIPTVYFLEGYSEFSLSTNLYTLSTYMANEINQIKSLNVITEGKVPDDCDTLVIMTPEKDFDEITTEAIKNYINNGGNILWFNAALGMSQDLPNVNSILAMYGVKPFVVGYINETDATKMMQGAPNVILTNVSYSTITKNIPTVLMLGATKINIVSDEELDTLKVSKTSLLETSEGAYFRTNFTIQSDKKQDSEESAIFTVGAELDKIVKDKTEETEEVTSKLVIYGENLFITDYSLTQNSSAPIISYSYNKDLVIDSVAYLVDRQQDIVIRKDTNKATYTATEMQNRIIQLVIFILPIIIIIVGIIVWQHRRRKK